MPGPRTICVRTAMALVLAALVGSPATYGATFLVMTTDDDGAGSLRQAMTDANATPGPDTIAFAIPSAGVPLIAPTTPLPTLTAPATIDGTTQLPAASVELDGQATLFAVGLTVAGGNSTIRGLVINRFGGAAIVLSGPGGNVIEGNRIGCDVAGTQVRSPLAYGIEVSGSPANRIGGASPGAGNLISGNLFGIFVHGSAATGTVIEGNLIGTDATGAVAVPNAAAGIWILGSGGTIVGGADPAAGNVIAGNATDGIDIGGGGGVDTIIAGNTIGLAADRTAPLGNGHDGVYVYGGAGGSSIGSAAANWIGANAGAGVRLETSAGTGNTIRGNVFLANTGLGIDLGVGGATPNDAGDLDGGANDQQNFPMLDAAFIGGTQIAGTLDGAANGTFVLEVFATSTCDPSGYGEGAALLAVQAITTDGAGHREFTAALSRNVDASLEYVTATVTDSLGNTSEFSPCTPATLLPTTTTSSSTTTSTTLVEETTTSTTFLVSTTSTSLRPRPPPPRRPWCRRRRRLRHCRRPRRRRAFRPRPPRPRRPWCRRRRRLRHCPRPRRRRSLPPPSTTTSTTLVQETTTSTTLPPPTTSTSLPPPSTTTSTTLVQETTTSTTLPPAHDVDELPPPSTTTSTTWCRRRRRPRHCPRPRRRRAFRPRPPPRPRPWCRDDDIHDTARRPPRRRALRPRPPPLRPPCSRTRRQPPHHVPHLHDLDDHPCVHWLRLPLPRRGNLRLDPMPADGRAGRNPADAGPARQPEALGRLFRRGQLLLDSAEVRCQAAKSGHSKHKLRAVGRRLHAALRVVRGGYGRSVPSPGEGCPARRNDAVAGRHAHLDA